jgi:hypothetical protein
MATVSGFAKKPGMRTHRVPPNAWTVTAPSGSSIRSRWMSLSPKTQIHPAITPQHSAEYVGMVEQGDVTATVSLIEPFTMEAQSKYLSTNRAIISVVIPADADKTSVFTAASAT